MKQDLYNLLGVERNASEQDIKSAYRKRAMQYHPDRNPGDSSAEKKFKEINNAYDILKDSQKKAAYDQYGAAAFDGTGHQAQSGFAPGGFGDIFEEMFSEFTGRSSRSSQGQSAQKGADLRYDMSITLDEAFSGLKKKIAIRSYIPCASCSGSGSAKGAPPIMCRTCAGRGHISSQQGFFTVERTCPSCHGIGQTITNPCKQCSGTGRCQSKRTLSVTIPAGIENDTRIRLAGEGEAGLRGGRQGDLYVFLSIYPHEFFRREETSIGCHATICMVTAVLGGSIDIPTLDGTKTILKIPEGTQSGKELRLKSKGMPLLRQSGRGDMYVKISVETPVNLTLEQKDILRQFNKASQGKNNSPKSYGFIDKIKSFFSSLALLINIIFSH